MHLPRILIVDDDPVQRLLVREQLSTLQAEFHEATDAGDGLVQAQRLRPAVVVCDWVMPGGGGLGLCRAISEDADLAGIRVVMLTGLGDPRDAHVARQAGASAFLRKPASARELREVVGECLTGRRRFVRPAPAPREGSCGSGLVE